MPSLDAARSGGRALGMGMLTLCMLAGVNVHEWMSAPEARRPVFQRWMKTWAHSLLWLFGVSASWSGASVPEAKSARLIVSNHRSPLDILLLLERFGGVMLSRADLATWPILGPAARKAETIFVDRENTLSGVLAVRALRDRLTAQHTVIVFPEGTTLAGDEVRPFQQGAFAAARGLPVEIVPVGIAYPPGSEFLNETFGEHMTRMARRPRTEVACVIGEPRPMSTARKGIAEQVREDVQELVYRARRELDMRAQQRG